MHNKCYLLFIISYYSIYCNRKKNNRIKNNGKKITRNKIAGKKNKNKNNGKKTTGKKITRNKITGKKKQE